MSKRTREYFDSFAEFDKLCEEQNVCAPPKEKRRKLTSGDNNRNRNKIQTQESIINQSMSPSPPTILLSKQNTNKKSDIDTKKMIGIMNNISLKPPSPNQSKYRNKNIKNTYNKPLINKEKLFAEYTFYIANIGFRNKRTGIRKHWSDLNKIRVKLFNAIIPRNGGKIITNINDFNVENKCLIIIVSEKINRKDFDQLFDNKIRQSKKYVFVTPEFITCSLKYQNRLALKQFKPKCLTQTVEKSDIVMMDKTKQHKEQLMNKQKHILNRNDIHTGQFVFNIENDGHRVNYNSNITKIFGEMECIYKCLGDKWREFAYKKANGFIKKYPKKIETEYDIKLLIKIKGFSKKLGDKALEIINTSK
eukprot:38510_1